MEIINSEMKPEIGSDSWFKEYAFLKKSKKEADQKHQESIRITDEIEAKLRELNYSPKKNLIAKLGEDKKIKQLQEELNRGYLDVKNQYIELLEITKKYNEKTIEIQNYNYDKIENQFMSELKRSSELSKEMVEIEKQKMTTSNPDFGKITSLENEIKTLKNEKISLQSEIDKLKKIIDKGEEKYKILKTEFDKSLNTIDELNAYIDELEGK